MLKVSVVTKADYPKLVDFLVAFPGEKSPKDFWIRRCEYWWDKNPAYSSQIKRGWFLFKDGRIVGFIGNIPSFFQLNGQQLIASSGTTWRVLPEYKFLSMKLFQKLIAASKDTILFGTTPRPYLEKLLPILGYKPFPMLENKLYIDLLNARARIYHKTKSTFLANIGRLLFLGTNDIHQLPNALAELANSSLRLEALDKADERFNKLWEKTKSVFLHTSVRTAEVINWQCFGNEDFKKILFGVFENESLLGYFVFKLQESNALQIAECIDIWVDPDKGRIIEAMIIALRQYARKNNIDAIVYPNFKQEFKESYNLMGLCPWKSKKQSYYYRVNRNLHSSISYSNSYFVLLQGDAYI